MILAFDVGNTNIVMGVLDEEKTYFLTRFATDHSKTEAEYAVLVKNILEIKGVAIDDIKGGIISSVVPPMNDILGEVIRLLTGHNALIVGPGLKTGLNIAVVPASCLPEICDTASDYGYTDPSEFFGTRVKLAGSTTDVRE